MDFREYLIDTFSYNDYANKLVLKKIQQLPEQTESIRLFSHLINSQNKWLKRIKVYPQDTQMDWWKPTYILGELEQKWNESVAEWIHYLRTISEKELFEEKRFIGFDGAHWSSPLKDIALQLNYHSIHHRAQIQTIIRAQGLVPDFVDYIGTKYKRLEEI